MQSIGDNQEFGYPALAALIDELRSMGIETIPEGMTPHSQARWEMIWGVVNACRWAMTLGIYIADGSKTTFAVRGGWYTLDGTPTEYVPGEPIDPVDNDTTYVWLGADGQVGSGVDGDGWPVDPHIKLAEVDVDEDGVITAIRDLRGIAFLNFNIE
jgi:hypothetical protein